MKNKKNKVLSFEDFEKTEIEQKDEISDISDEIEDEELVDSPNVKKLEDETKKPSDYYDVKQDFMTPKPFRKKH